MASKDWEIAYPRTKDRESPIYRNKKTYQYIEIASKQLGSFDNFKEEKYPFLVQDSGFSTRYEKWFNTRGEALRYLKKYMKEN